MNLVHRIVPYPVMSAFIFALWLVINSSLWSGHILFALVLALVLPPLTARFWPDRPHPAKPLAGIRLFLVVLWDIVVASWIVARLVLGPVERLRSDFIEVPLDLRDPFVATILGSIISLTPGTVSVEIDRERWVILVHALDIDDADAIVSKIKQRYEAPLKEVFSC